ncbi:MAG: redoxin domain-containing protein [Dechloromonas sp.]|nr:redoxin domain-containing protein [Dechloromonas sp.]
MKQGLLTALLGMALVGPAMALSEGDTAPDFQTSAALNGNAFTFALRDNLKKGPVVVYFYPSAYTNGCNIQAHTFAEKNERFKAAGAQVVGVSLDSIARLKTFSADPDFCAGKIAVASDADGKIARSYGVNVRTATRGRKDTRGNDIDHAFAERTTFVVGSDGRVAGVVGGVSPTENVDKALTIVQGLAASR